MNEFWKVKVEYSDLHDKNVLISNEIIIHEFIIQEKKYCFQFNEIKLIDLQDLIIKSLNKPHEQLKNPSEMMSYFISRRRNKRFHIDDIYLEKFIAKDGKYNEEELTSILGGIFDSSRRIYFQ